MVAVCCHNNDIHLQSAKVYRREPVRKWLRFPLSPTSYHFFFVKGLNTVVGNLHIADVLISFVIFKKKFLLYYYIQNILWGLAGLKHKLYLQSIQVCGILGFYMHFMPSTLSLL